MEKKVVSAAEKNWRLWHHDERREAYIEKCMWFFSAPSGFLRSPEDRQVAQTQPEETKD